MSEVGKFPYYPFYPRDFIADGPVMQLEPMEELLYRRLLDYQWLNGSVPSVTSGIGKAGRFSERATEKLWLAVEHFFPVGEDGERRNRRLEREREKMIASRDARSKAGSKGMKSRYRKPNSVTNEAPNETVTRSNMAEPEAEPEPKKQHPTSPPRQAKFWALVNAAPNGLDFADDFTGWLKSAFAPESMAAEFLAMLDGLNGPGGKAVPVAILGQALRDMRNNREGFNANTLRTFADKLMRPKTPRTGPSHSQTFVRPERKAPGLEMMETAKRVAAQDAAESAA